LLLLTPLTKDKSKDNPRDKTLNKLAVLAFTLLVFFSTMLWYLANGSLNEYLKSQITLQGNYYSGQTTHVASADFSPNTGTALFEQLSVGNSQQEQNILTIDQAQAVLSSEQTHHQLTKIESITINTLRLNIEQTSDNQTNIESLIEKISLTLANDYPELYPAISAKIYAAKNPQLNAEAYAKEHPEAGPIIERTQQKKTRGKPQQKMAIATVHIKNLELNSIQGDSETLIVKNDVQITAIGGATGMVINQLGGEILLNLLKLAEK